MTDDPIVAEVRAIREEFARRFGNDLSAICAEYRRLQRESGRTVVSFPPQRPPGWIEPVATPEPATTP